MTPTFSLLRFDQSESTKLKLLDRSPVFDTMLNSSFKEASENKLIIDHVKSDSVQIFLNLLTDSETTDDISDVEILFEVDDLLQTYMIEPGLRANFQKQFWPLLKAEFLKSPAEVLERITRDLASDEVTGRKLYWPVSLCKTAFEGKLIDEIVSDFPKKLRLLLLSVL